MALSFNKAAGGAKKSLSLPTLIVTETTKFA